jgi:hypothetical protein
MSVWAVFALLVIGVPLMLVVIATILPCEGCRLRRERIAKALAKMSAKTDR